MRRAICCVGLFFGLALPATAGATRAWLAPSTLGEGKFTECPARTAMDAHGDTAAEWANAEGLQLATRAGGGPWQLAPPITYGAPVCPVAMVSDPGGDTYALWERFDGVSTHLEASYKPGGGTWEAPASVSVGAKNPEVIPAAAAFDAYGNLIVVWRSDATHGIYSSFRPAGGSWQTTQHVSSDAETGYGLDVAMSSYGEAFAVWQHVSGGKETVDATRSAEGGTWGMQEPVSAEATEISGNRPVVAMIERVPTVGAPAPFEPVVAFEHMEGGVVVTQVVSSNNGPGWPLPTTISVPGQVAERPQLALAPNGVAVAVWEHPAGKETVIQAASRSPAGTWLAPATLSESGEVAKQPHVAIGGGGGAFAVWDHNNGSNEVIQSAVMPAGGTWQPPTTLSESGQDAYIPAVAADREGDAVAIWERHNGAGLQVQAAGYAGAGPSVSLLPSPSMVLAGGDAAFTALPFEVWAPITAVTWTFGDGTSASGAETHHLFMTAGVYTVSATAGDALGNNATASTTIRVLPAPSPAHRPSLTALSQTHRRWREGTARAHESRRRQQPPLGTTFSFRLDEHARVTFAFTQPETGRLVGGHCVHLTRANRHRGRCTRPATRGTLGFQGHAGVNAVVFQGRLAHSRLAPGTYTLVATASSAGLSSPAQHLTFMITR
jgi:hypothetical protein